MKKVIVDTDIGNDIDDAICLAYLLANPDCQLVGITTVTGKSEKRAQMASVICKVAGKDIPIYPGAEEPILIPQKQKFPPQAEVIKNWEYQKNFKKGYAIEFLIKTIRENHNEINLLTIGPLTNIALLFKVVPDIPSLLGGLFMMCGVFKKENQIQTEVEWNSFCDPYTTYIVYKSPVKVHRSIGLDVTKKSNNGKR